MPYGNSVAAIRERIFRNGLTVLDITSNKLTYKRFYLFIILIFREKKKYHGDHCAVTLFTVKLNKIIKQIVTLSLMSLTEHIRYNF